MDIDVVDNFLDFNEYQNVLQYVLESENYRYGEIDKPGCMPVGMVSDLKNPEIIELFKDTIIKKFPSKIDGRKLYRSYVNCFSPGDNPYFHIDSDKIGNFTFLFYPCMYDKWHPDYGGETQFFDGHKIVGIPPIPNRMVCFDGTLLHRATTYREFYRFTVALKYFLI